MRHSCVLHVWHAWVMCVPCHMHESCMCLDAQSLVCMCEMRHSCVCMCGTCMSYVLCVPWCTQLLMHTAVDAHTCWCTHLHQACQTRKRMNGSCHTCKHMSHITRMHHSCDTWAIWLCVYMCDVSFDTCESCRTRNIHVTRVNTAVTGFSQRRGICVAVCCSVLQCVAVCCGERGVMRRLQLDVFVRYTGVNVYVGVCVFGCVCSNNNTLQNTAAHCPALQHTEAQCSALQRNATHCDTLQHTAQRCNTLQNDATHCNTPDGGFWS